MDSKKAGLSGALKKGQIIGAGSNFSKELANTPATFAPRRTLQIKHGLV